MGARGREIFFQGPYEGSPRLMVVSVAAGRGYAAPREADAAPRHARGRTDWRNQAVCLQQQRGLRYDVFPDGRRFVMIRGPDQEGTREIVVVQHFLEEVNRLAPRR